MKKGRIWQSIAKKLGLKPNVPWYSNWKIVGPLGVVVLLALVLSQNTQLFQGRIPIVGTNQPDPNTYCGAIVTDEGLVDVYDDSCSGTKPVTPEARPTAPGGLIGESDGGLVTRPSEGLTTGGGILGGGDLTTRPSEGLTTGEPTTADRLRQNYENAREAQASTNEGLDQQRRLTALAQNCDVVEAGRLYNELGNDPALLQTINSCSDLSLSVVLMEAFRTSCDVNKGKLAVAAIQYSGLDENSQGFLYFLLAGTIDQCGLGDEFAPEQPADYSLLIDYYTSRTPSFTLLGGNQQSDRRLIDVNNLGATDYTAILDAVDSWQPDYVIPGIAGATPDFSDYFDRDSDGVADQFDNCPDRANANQADADNDGIGDVCDSTQPQTAILAIGLFPETASVAVGQTTRLRSSIELIPGSGSGYDNSVEWLTSGPSVATVSDDGTVTGVSAGTATITLRSKVNPQIKDTAFVTVTPAQNPPAADSVAPVITVTSAATTQSASYTLTGSITDNSGRAGIVATTRLNAGAASDLTLGSDGAFQVNLTLTEGVNTITVTARDAAGNSSQTFKSVTYSSVVPPNPGSDLSVTIDYPTGSPLVPELRATVPLDKVVVNLYKQGGVAPFYTIYFYCRTGESQCPSYQAGRYTDASRTFDLEAWARVNLPVGDYYYRAFVRRGDEVASDNSPVFHYDRGQYPGPQPLPPTPSLQDCAVYFADMRTGSEYCEAVAFVRDLGLFLGSPDGRGNMVFRPYDPLMRTELFAIANRFADLPAVEYIPARDGDLGYRDLGQYVNNPNAAWFMAEIKRTQQYGNDIVRGYPDGTMRPTKLIVVPEAVKVILEAGWAGDVLGALQPVIFVQDGPQWYRGYFDFLNDQGVSLPRADLEITRGEVAQLFTDLYRSGLAQR